MTDIIWTNTRVRLGDLKPWADNPRLSTKAQARRLLSSFEKFGQVQTVAIGPDCEVYDGHQRLSALLTIHGEEYEIDARQSSRPLTDAERRELVISLHAGAVGSWDWERVSGWNAGELQGWGMDKDLLKSWNNDANNLKELLKSEQPTADAEPQTELGQMWSIGVHRLLIGDSTYPETVSALLEGNKAAMVFTDPPYALMGNSTGVNGITDDKMTAPFFREVFKRTRDFTNPYSHVYVCCDWHSAFALRQAGADVGLIEKNLIVWDKGDGGVGAMYQQCHELIWLFTNTPHKTTLSRKQSGERTVNGVPNIWRVGRASADRMHGAQKPTELVEIPVKYGCDEGDVVMDLFGGSGTTMVACENLRRVCRMMEVDPKYAAVILERMATAFPHLEIRRVAE